MTRHIFALKAHRNIIRLPISKLFYFFAIDALNVLRSKVAYSAGGTSSSLHHFKMHARKHVYFSKLSRRYISEENPLSFLSVSPFFFSLVARSVYLPSARVRSFILYRSRK